MPNNWKTYKLSDIGEIIGGGTPSTSKQEYYNGDIPWITPRDLSNHSSMFISKGERSITQLGLKNSSAKLMPEGSVLLTSRAPIGYLAISKNQVCTNQGFKSIVVNQNLVNNKFIYYLLKSNIDLLLQNASGSTFQEISGSVVKNLEFDFPPLEEQKSIATILSDIDDKIENNLAINKTLEKMAKALYKHWFVDFGPFQDGEFVESELGKIPKGWEVLSLDDVSTLTAGGDKPRNFSNTKTDECKIPIYSNGITNDGLYGFTDTARINEESITVSARGTIGFVCLRLEPYLPIVRLIAVVPKQDFVTSKYLFYWLKTQNINGNGTTQQQLTVPDFKVTKVLVPKFEIINKFTDIINPYYDEINSNIKENQTLTQLRDTLLPKLISGEVRLKEFQES